MSLSGRKFQHCLCFVVCVSSIGLTGCQATSNRLSHLPGLGWMASDDDASLVASYDRSDLPPPSAVTEPYRPDARQSGPRGIDGSVASFDRPYASTGYPSPQGGYQTGPYDAGASAKSSASTANGRSRYYDQFTNDSSRSATSYNRAGGYGSPAGSSSRYSDPQSRSSAADSLARKATSGVSRYSQTAQDTLNQAQSRYTDTLSQAKSRYSDAVDGAGQAIDRTRDSVSQQVGGATQALANAAANLRGDAEGKASNTVGALTERFGSGRQQVENRAYDVADSVRSQVDRIDNTVGNAASATRDALNSGEEAYRTATAPRYETSSNPGPWRPGSTSDYRR